VSGSAPPPSSVPRLRWVAQEDLLYEPGSNTLHRRGCRRAGGGEGNVALGTGEALWLVWAPAMCACRPDLTLALGADTGSDVPERLPS
jgi:hypothetical protein